MTVPSRKVVGEISSLRSTIITAERNLLTITGVEWGRIIEGDLRMHAPLDHCCNITTRISKTEGTEHPDVGILKPGITNVTQAKVKGLTTPVQPSRLTGVKSKMCTGHHLTNQILIILVIDG